MSEQQEIRRDHQHPILPLANTPPTETFVVLRRRISEACCRSNRKIEEVRLIGVSKGVSAHRVEEFLMAGLTHLGENYVQEALPKIQILRKRFPETRFHFIGRLQRNKVPVVVGSFDVIESVDTPELLTAVHRQAEKLGIRQKILLQVNVAKDLAKGGTQPEALQSLAHLSQELPHIELSGLMTIGSFTPDFTERRVQFMLLRKLRDDLARQFSLPLPELSMGMSEDFEIAIECGATIVRCGRSLFGARPPKGTSTSN